MGKDAGDVIEDLFWDAWNKAEAYRTAKGEKARKPVIEERKNFIQGAPRRRVGPRSYKITLWLQPWQYLELFEQQKKDRHHGSLTAWMHARLTDERIAHAVPTRENLARMRAEAKEMAVVKGAPKVLALPPVPRRRRARSLPPSTVKVAAARRRAFV